MYKVYKNTRTAPIEFYVVVEDDIDERHAEHTGRPDGFYTGNAQKRGCQWVGNLFLDVFLGLSLAFCSLIRTFSTNREGTVVRKCSNKFGILLTYS